VKISSTSKTLDMSDRSEFALIAHLSNREEFRDLTNRQQTEYPNVAKVEGAADPRH